MFTITFYSYKGGVGRTLALANVAYLLAADEQYPCKVLMWDFDLEAPGLQQIFKKVTIGHHGGFVDMVTDYVDMVTNETEKVDLPTVSDYIVSTGVRNLDLLPAGRMDRAYSEKFERLNWQLLYEQMHGWDLIENIKQQAEDLGYEYLLVDSRTGHSDVGGICTQQLPNCVALLFRLNNQNIDGSHRVYQSIANWSEQQKRTIAVVPIISPAWPFASSEANDLMRSASRLFERRIPRRRLPIAGTRPEFAVISFDSALTFGERLLSLERSDFVIKPQICEDYERLTDEVRDQNQDDPRAIRRKARHAVRREEHQDAFYLFSRLIARRPDNIQEWQNLLDVVRSAPVDVQQTLEVRLQAFIEQFANTPEAMGYAEFAQGEYAKRRGSIPDAIRHYSIAIETMKEPLDALHARASCYQSQGLLEEAEKDLTKAIDWCAQAPQALDADEAQKLFGERSEIYLLMGRYDDAVDDLSAMKQAGLLTFTDGIRLVQALVGVGLSAEALTQAVELEQSVKKTEAPVRVRPLLVLSIALMSAHAFERARDFITEAKALSSSDEEVVVEDMLLLLLECMEDDSPADISARMTSIVRRIEGFRSVFGWPMKEVMALFTMERMRESLSKPRLDNVFRVIHEFTEAHRQRWIRDSELRAEREARRLGPPQRDAI